MTALLWRGMNFCFDTYANYLHCQEFFRDPQAKQENLHLLSKMETIVQQFLAKADRKALNLKLSLHETHPYLCYAGEDRKDLERMQIWIRALQEKAAGKECIELPYLSHMTSFSSLCKIVETGTVRVSSAATPGAWFSTKPEFNYGNCGVLLDIHHAPNGNYYYLPFDNHEELGVQRPFNFKSNGVLHLAGIIVKDREQADDLRKNLQKTEKELPDHLFVSEKEAALRCWVTSQARTECKLSFHTLDDYLHVHGGTRIRSGRIETIQNAALGILGVLVPLLFFRVCC